MFCHQLLHGYIVPGRYRYRYRYIGTFPFLLVSKNTLDFVVAVTATPSAILTALLTVILTAILTAKRLAIVAAIPKTRYRTGTIPTVYRRYSYRALLIYRIVGTYLLDLVGTGTAPFRYISG